MWGGFVTQKISCFCLHTTWGGEAAVGKVVLSRRGDDCVLWGKMRGGILVVSHLGEFDGAEDKVEIAWGWA